MRYLLLIIVSFASLAALSSCANYEWADDGSGALASAEGSCAAAARERVRDERPFGHYEAGPAGFPGDSPRDLERRETDLCLAKKGFKKVKVD